MGAGILTLYHQIFHAMDTATGRTCVWLGYKVLCVLLIHLWSKLACYAMSNDVQFQLVIMMLVSYCNLVVSISVCLCASTRRLICMGEFIFGAPLIARLSVIFGWQNQLNFVLI